MKSLFLTLAFLTSFFLTAQNMTIEKMGTLINSTAENVEGENGRWRFQINQTLFIVVTDSTHNRMRIISPIADIISIDDTMLKNALIANFHSALDVKYAISEGVLWSAYIHPLRELTEEQVTDAISQVYYANVNFGTTYASTSLVFPGSKPKEEEKKEVLKTRKI